MLTRCSPLILCFFRMFDDVRREESRHPYVHSFLEHTLRITDVKSGHGGSNAVIISSSEDRTCKVRYAFDI